MNIDDDGDDDDDDDDDDDAMDSKYLCTCCNRMRIAHAK